MASIHKDPRGKSPFFYCAFYSADGTRKFKSTKTKERREALRICAAWEDAELDARRGTLTTSQVRKVFNEILERAGDEPLDNFSVREWMEEWIKNKTSSRGEKTGCRYEKPIRDFLEFIGPRANLSLRALTPKDIREFRDAEAGSGKSPMTVNLAHKIVSSALIAAFRQGYIEKNPATGVDFLPTHAERVEKEIFTGEEISAILAAAPSQDWRGVILLGALAGMRLGDALSLKWGDVDLQTGTIRFTPAKTARLGKKLTVPMHPDLEAFFLTHPTGKTDKAPVFPSVASMEIGGRSGASRAFKVIMESAKVEAGIAREGKGKKGRNVSARSFHSLRHGYISGLAAAGVPIEVRRDLVGHASDKQSLAYTHPELQALRAAVAKLPAIKKQ